MIEPTTTEVIAAVELQAMGHFPYIYRTRGPGVTEAIACHWCSAWIDLSNLPPIAVDRRLLEPLGECPGKLYRPIHGTPWFDYSRGERW